MVSMRDIRKLGRQIGRDFHPERVVLFGSYAEGTATPDSDVDILVVLPFEGQSLDKSLDILNRVDVRFPIDLLARRPEDVKRRYVEGDPLIREALDKGRILYERHGKRMGREGRRRLRNGRS